MEHPNNFKLIIIIVLALLLGALVPLLYNQVKQPKDEAIFINLDKDPEEEKITVTHSSPVRVNDEIVTIKKIQILDLQGIIWTNAYTIQEEIQKEVGAINNQIPTNIKITDINQDGINEILLINQPYSQLRGFNLIAYDGKKIGNIHLKSPFILGNYDLDINQDKIRASTHQTKIAPYKITLTYKFRCEGGSECNSMDAEITQDPNTYKWSIEYWKNPKKIEPYWTEYINEYNQGVDNWGENVYPPTKFLQYTSE